MTTENTEVTTTEPEVKNPEALLKKNRELLRELAEVKAALLTAQNGLQAAQDAETDWRARWHDLEVLKPLEADLRGSSAGPWKYLKDTCLELGLLKMQADEMGIERAAWFDEKGEPADLKGGLRAFLSGVYERTGNDLGHCLRSTGVTGGGAVSSSESYAAKPTPAAPPPAPITPLGLR